MNTVLANHNMFKGNVPVNKVSSIDVAYAKELAEIRKAKSDSFIKQRLDSASQMEQVKNKIQVTINNWFMRK